MKKILTSLLLLCTFSLTAQTEAYEAKVREFLDASGSVPTFNAAVDQMIDQTQVAYSEVPDQFWNELKAEFKKDVLGDLTDILAPVYQNHYSEGDLEGLIAFYNSPIGKKFADKAPVIARESLAAGQRWGMQVGEKIAEKLANEGY